MNKEALEEALDKIVLANRIVGNEVKPTLQQNMSLATTYVELTVDEIQEMKDFLDDYHMKKVTLDESLIEYIDGACDTFVTSSYCYMLLKGSTDVIDDINLDATASSHNGGGRSEFEMISEWADTQLTTLSELKRVLNFTYIILKGLGRDVDIDKALLEVVNSNLTKFTSEDLSQETIDKEIKIIEDASRYEGITTRQTGVDGVVYTAFIASKDTENEKVYEQGKYIKPSWYKEPNLTLTTK